MNPELPSFEARRSDTDTQFVPGKSTADLTLAENVLRADRERTAPPAALARRLAESVAREPRTTDTQWWRRWFKS